MTERYDTVAVVFEKEIREDDLEHWVEALKMIRGVVEVIPIEDKDKFVGGGYYRARHEFRMELYKLAAEFK